MLADLRQKALDTGIEEAFAYIEANLTEDYAFYSEYFILECNPSMDSAAAAAAAESFFSS